uniref:EGF-like domain-containing protein n=1 Tax=Meloidogyne hapla TaxID=6305 RepID=A0A1I8BRQ3_MELHA
MKEKKKKKIEQKKRLGFFNHFLHAGIWHFGLLNDKTESEYIELIAELEKPLDIEQKSNEIISQCHSDCFGKGKCIEGRCVCHPGYGGLFCEETFCPVLCSGQGIFNKGRCLCHQGFRGVECEETIEWCDNKDCGIGGQCQSDGTCLCLPGWIGKYCEQNIEQIKENIKQIKNEEGNIKEECLLDCSERGDCILINQNGEDKKNKECKCLPGWTGINCQIELCPKNCSSNGECMLSAKRVDGEGWWHCECNFGYYGEYCQFRAESNCEDGEDNDEDGLTDCEDSTECCSHNSCLSNSLCLGSFVSPELLLKLDFTNESRQQENTTLQIPFFERVRFLFDSGDLSVQRYADTRLLDPKLLSVLRGRILSIKGGSLAGVRVSVADHPQQGFSLSRSFSLSSAALEDSQENYIDTSIGEFELAVNGGAEVILQFVRQPFGRILKTFVVPSNQILDVGNVWMDFFTNVEDDENVTSTIS